MPIGIEWQATTRAADTAASVEGALSTGADLASQRLIVGPDVATVQPPNVLGSGIIQNQTTVVSPVEPNGHDVIVRLDAIQAELLEIKSLLVSDYARIGHNHPPSGLDDLPLNVEDVEISDAAITAARGQLSSAQPDGTVLRLCWLEFQRIASRIAPWIEEFADHFMAAAGKEAGKRIAIGLVDHFAKLYHHLMALLSSMKDWF